MTSNAAFLSITALAAAVAALAMSTTVSFGAECPADAVVAAGAGQRPGATAPKDVTDTVLAAIDLGAEKIAAKDRMFRLRELIVKPGGEVPWHSHEDRPAIIYILEGELTEFSSACAVPIVHRAGEVAQESVGLAHWWRNDGDMPARLLSADIPSVVHDQHQM